MNNISLTRLSLINPVFAKNIIKLAATLSDKNITIEIVQGLRTWNQQQDLYNQGRTTPGKIVTNSKPGNSWHNFGLAVDMCPFINGAPIWDVQHDYFKELIKSANDAGFVCGAHFVSFPDYDHFQMTGIFPVNPNDEVRQLFKDGGIIAVWDEAKL